MMFYAIALLSAIALGDDTTMHFTDVSQASGLGTTVPTTGNTKPTEILETKGTGLALIDLEGDGDLDLVLPNGATLTDTEHGPGALFLLILPRNQGSNTRDGVSVLPSAMSMQMAMMTCSSRVSALTHCGSTMVRVTSATAQRERVLRILAGVRAQRLRISIRMVISIFT